MEEVDNYHLWKTKIYGSKEEAVKDMLEFHATEEFDNLTLIEGVKEILNQISKAYDVYFITSRPIKIKEKTKDFLFKEFPNNDFKLIHSGEVHGGKPKSEICLEEDIGLLIEDNALYARDCAENGVQLFLLDKPWNRNSISNPNIIRVNHWNEMLENLK